MSFDLTPYSNLAKIIDKVYKGKIIYDGHQDGAYDENWVKEYDLFYNKQAYASPCVKRIFFRTNEENGKRVGFSDIRPLSDGSEISETYLNPPDHLTQQNDAYIKCLRTYNQYGENVTCVPYIMPESIFGMCIHASVWICLKTLEGTIEKPLSIPEIQSTARGSPYTDREGLPFTQTARILRMSRAYSFYINNSEPPFLDDDGMLLSLYAYVESGLPVIIGVDTNDLKWWKGAREQGYHTIVAIGHTMSDNNVDGFIFHDESALPYVTLSIDELLKAWHIPRKSIIKRLTVRELLVAVPPEVSITFHRVYQQFNAWLSVLISKGLIDNKDVDHLDFRFFLDSPMPLFTEVIQKATPSLIKAILDLKAFPKYLWYIYLFDQNADKKNLSNSKGLFVRDATRETQFRLLYLKKGKTAIYQTTPDLTYQVWDDKEEKKQY